APPDPVQRQVQQIQQDQEDSFKEWRQSVEKEQQESARQRRKVHVLQALLFAVCGCGAVACGRRSLQWLDAKPLLVRLAAALGIGTAFLAVGVALVFSL